MRTLIRNTWRYRRKLTKAVTSKGLSRRQARIVVRIVLSTITDALKEHRRITLSFNGKYLTFERVENETITR